MGYWPLRLKIAFGVAEGLAWLHQNQNVAIIHGAISSKCILLDKHFEPKISNFWEAKFIIRSKHSLSSWSSRIILQNRHDDEDFESGYKKDIYFFGMLLLEIITGKEPEVLCSIARDVVNRPSSSSVFPPFHLDFELDEILMDQGFEDEILQCLELAKNCVRSNPSQRPSMVQVHATLAAFAKMITYTDDL